jgi:hypothetical protein
MLIERGLQRVIAETNPGIPFKLRRASFKGKGLRRGLRDASWEHIRDLPYKGHGS